MKKKVPPVHHSKPDLSSVRRLTFSGRIPAWMKEFVIEVRRALALEEFDIDVFYGDLKLLNKIIREEDPRLESLTKDQVGAAVINPKYLTAVILFVKPFKLCRDALKKVAHEFFHIFLTYKIFSRVQHELTDHFIDRRLKDTVYETLLNIEERACEHLITVLENIGFFERYLPAPRR